MKYTTLITLVLLSLTTGAKGLCQTLEAQEQDQYLSLGNFQDNQNINYQENTGKPTFSQSLMDDHELIDHIGEFDSESCENALTQDTLMFKGHTLRLIYTIEDDCDGGNSYGYIINEADKVIATIEDSDIYCL